MAASFDNQMLVLGIFLSRSSEPEYADALSAQNWDSFIAYAPGQVRALLAQTLPYSDYRHFFNQVLTPGMPAALPPVESLYKDWGGHKAGLQYGQGFYLGESARAVQGLFDSLEMSVPAEYSATPDHLLLLLELYGFLYEHAGHSEAQVFAASHFDWLDTYRSLLAKRIASEDDESLVKAGVFYQGLIDYIAYMVRSEQAAQSA